MVKSPFPYFGGKSRVAADVWCRFGDVKNYVEPFAGSLAVLLARRKPGIGYTETVNDLDGLLSNFWRALSRDPEGVIHWADYPLVECDFFARRAWMRDREDDLKDRLMKDPDFYDVKAAGWWVWGQSAANGDQWRNRGDLRGLALNLNLGSGIHKSSASARDVLAPVVSRMHDVRVMCGSYTRALGPGVLHQSPSMDRITGIFLDPPYPGYGDIYGASVGDIRDDLQAWCRAHENIPTLRLALCGYEGDYDLPGWDVQAWSQTQSYQARGETARDTPERIWYSPHCLPEPVTLSLF